MDYKSQ